MATTRIYYDGSTTREFDATVTRSEARGEHTAVWLDRTAFYPTSGGQPHDLGTLAGLPLIDVLDDEDGDIVHLVSGSGPEPGTPVHGVVDWPRRFDHMQQHTGQHLLSAVIEHAFGARTVSFHLGTDASTIDIDRELTPAQIERAEVLANDAVWADCPVTVRYATDDEARALPLRKEPVRTGTLRIVEIEGHDLSACGGTHVARTGAIGQVSIASWERFKGGQRLEFLCGRRTLTRFQVLRDTTAATIRLLSVLPSELPAAVERLQADLKEQRRTIMAAQLELAKYEATALAAESAASPIGRVVLQAIDGDAVRLKALASAVATTPGVLAVLVSTSTPVLAVAARAADLAVPCQELIGSLAKAFSGRGGGKPDLAQCGGLQASSEQVLAAAREWLSTRVP
ncbi:MAG: DHHA1 domain-containing protein [Vicinamibacterales bacterium]